MECRAQSVIFDRHVDASPMIVYSVVSAISRGWRCSEVVDSRKERVADVDSNYWAPATR